jgi:hypothetical protein
MDAAVGMSGILPIVPSSSSVNDPLFVLRRGEQLDGAGDLDDMIERLVMPAPPARTSASLGRDSGGARPSGPRLGL